MMTTSCRINFTGQEVGMCASKPVQISRTQPAAISDHMSSVAWNSFCDRIDEALKPLESVKRMSLITMFVFRLVFIIFLIFPVSDILSNIEFLNDLSDYSYIILVVPIFGVILVRCHAAVKAKSVMINVERSCVDVSNQHSFLSFHIRSGILIDNSGPRLSFIEVIITEVIIGNPEVGAPVTAVPLYGLSTSDTAPSPYAPGSYALSATNITSSKVKRSTADQFVEPLLVGSTSDQFVELEGIKAIISSEEYERKRKEILDSV